MGWLGGVASGGWIPKLPGQNPPAPGQPQIQPSAPTPSQQTNPDLISKTISNIQQTYITEPIKKVSQDYNAFQNALERKLEANPARETLTNLVKSASSNDWLPKIEFPTPQQSKMVPPLETWERPFTAPRSNVSSLGSITATSNTISPLNPYTFNDGTKITLSLSQQKPQSALSPVEIDTIIKTQPRTTITKSEDWAQNLPMGIGGILSSLDPKQIGIQAPSVAESINKAYPTSSFKPTDSWSLSNTPSFYAKNIVTTPDSRGAPVTTEQGSTFDTLRKDFIEGTYGKVLPKTESISEDTWRKTTNLSNPLLGALDVAGFKEPTKFVSGVERGIYDWVRNKPDEVIGTAVEGYAAGKVFGSLNKLGEIGKAGALADTTSAYIPKIVKTYELAQSAFTPAFASMMVAGSASDATSGFKNFNPEQVAPRLGTNLFKTAIFLKGMGAATLQGDKLVASGGKTMPPTELSQSPAMNKVSKEMPSSLISSRTEQGILTPPKKPPIIDIFAPAIKSPAIKPKLNVEELSGTQKFLPNEYYGTPSFEFKPSDAIRPTIPKNLMNNPQGFRELILNAPKSFTDQLLANIKPEQQILNKGATTTVNNKPEILALKDLTKNTNKEYVIITDKDLNVIFKKESTGANIPSELGVEAMNAAKAAGVDEVYHFHTHPTIKGVQLNTLSSSTKYSNSGDILVNSWLKDNAQSEFGVKVLGNGIITDRGVSIYRLPKGGTTDIVGKYGDLVEQYYNIPEQLRVNKIERDLNVVEQIARRKAEQDLINSGSLLKNTFSTPSDRSGIRPGTVFDRQAATRQRRQADELDIFAKGVSADVLGTTLSMKPNTGNPISLGNYGGKQITKRQTKRTTKKPTYAKQPKVYIGLTSQETVKIKYNKPKLDIGSVWGDILTVDKKHATTHKLKGFESLYGVIKKEIPKKGADKRKSKPDKEKSWLDIAFGV